MLEAIVHGIALITSLLSYIGLSLAVLRACKTWNSATSSRPSYKPIISARRSYDYDQAIDGSVATCNIHIAGAPSAQQAQGPTCGLSAHNVIR